MPSCLNELIDRIHRPQPIRPMKGPAGTAGSLARSRSFGDWLPIRGNECPMLLPYRTLADPRSNRADLRWRQGMARFRRRHQIVGILGDDPPQQFTVFGVAGDDHATFAIDTQQSGSTIKTKARLASPLIRTMTFETRSREKWPDLRLEIHAGFDLACMRRTREFVDEMPERQHREVGDERSRDVKMAGTFHMPSLSIGICDPRNI